jgi:hypothetical protein
VDRPPELGDVITLRGEDVSFTSGWILHDGAVRVASVFFSDPAVVIVLHGARDAFHLCTEVRMPEGVPAPTVEIGGTPYTRVLRLPCTVERLSAPGVPAEAVFACYREAAGEDRLFAVEARDGARAFRGTLVPERDVEYWGNVRPPGDR